MENNATFGTLRRFYVIVPSEYRSLSCLPADQFIPALMKHLGLAYYAGLLTAAQYYGSDALSEAIVAASYGYGT